MRWAAAQLDAFFNVLPGNYNLNLDIITATKQMASVKIDRTDKPFEAGVLYKKEVGTLTSRCILKRILSPLSSTPSAELAVVCAGAIRMSNRLL